MWGWVTGQIRDWLIQFCELGETTAKMWSNLNIRLSTSKTTEISGFTPDSM